MKSNLVFICSECSEEYLKWQGKCDTCGAWNTLKEFKTNIDQKYRTSLNANIETQILPILTIKNKNFHRIITKISEFDRALGGGIVPGSIILLGGDPGIGKSTLLLQVATNLKKVLYVCAEESPQQIKMRYDRLNLKASNLDLFPEINLNNIIETASKNLPELLIIDSIQTIYSQDFPSTPGSIVQVRECALRLQQFAKTSNIPVILVGHVTKEGSVAGPRMLEHLVDVVLYLEGEHFQNNRILRSAKNRFGATEEIGIFEMSEEGMKEVKNPSKLFLHDRLKDVPGGVVTATIEGTRSLLVEIQALTATTIFGYPQRRAAGFDLNRLQLLIAVLQKRANLNLSNQDVFINVVGGVKIKEPAVDLAVALAVAGALKNKPINSKLCAFGEVGLSGEIRKVSFETKRIAEAKRLGFSIFPKGKNINEVIRSYCV